MKLNLNSYRVRIQTTDPAETEIIKRFRRLMTKYTGPGQKISLQFPDVPSQLDDDNCLTLHFVKIEKKKEL